MADLTLDLSGASENLRRRVREVCRECGATLDELRPEAARVVGDSTSVGRVQRVLKCGGWSSVMRPSVEVQGG